MLFTDHPLTEPLAKLPQPFANAFPCPKGNS